VQVDADTCDYLLDLDYPHRPTDSYSTLEPRYAVQSDKWHRVHCQRFLDSSESPLLTRALWFPGLEERNKYGDYCMLLNKERAAVREVKQS